MVLLRADGPMIRPVLMETSVTTRAEAICIFILGKRRERPTVICRHKEGRPMRTIADIVPENVRDIFGFV